MLSLIRHWFVKAIVIFMVVFLGLLAFRYWEVNQPVETGGTDTSLGLFITGTQTVHLVDEAGLDRFQSEVLGYEDGGTTTYTIPDTYYGRTIETVYVHSVVICDVEQMSYDTYCKNPIPATFTLNGEPVTDDSAFTFTAGDVLTIVTTLN